MKSIKFIVILSFFLVPGLICQFFTRTPVRRDIHITSFRYGKHPSVIRCNRDDTLHLTFSSEDTGHSFFLEEFDIDVKVSPATDQVSVFSTSDPTEKPYFTKEVILIARHPGILNYLISKSNYRCHVWCGPMHAFEHGKLILLPNTLLISGIGGLCGILLLWIFSFIKSNPDAIYRGEPLSEPKNILKRPVINKMLKSRWPQIIVQLIAMALIYIVILTSLFGTKMSGRNLGVLMMWAVWLFLLVAVMIPFFGRIWCTICPLPFFGDLFQRRSFLNPLKGRTKEYLNKFSGKFMKWPQALTNNWLRLIVFMILATFSTTLVATPWISGVAVLLLLITPTVMALFWELRAFCRYVCPVSVYIEPFSRISFFVLGSKDRQVCTDCRQHFCKRGNINGWSCPYGIDVGTMTDSTGCGLCLECLRSCTYNNVAVYRRPFASETGTKNISEAWLTISIFTVAIVYSIVYLGHWPVIRELVNILDKKNWDLFGLYSLGLWSTTLAIMPGILYFLAFCGSKISGNARNTRDLFLVYAGTLLPLGMMIWISFVIPMFFVNVTFILQSLSDPFGWGWDFFGTANIPWHQFLPRYIPWFQTIFILIGYYLSLRNVPRSFDNTGNTNKEVCRMSVPITVFITVSAFLMLVFFTN